MRHLLSHTAGFEDRIAGVIAGPDGVATTLRDSVAIDPPEQVFEPGTVPSYSNYSNGLAAYVVERITGRTFEDVVAEEVFGPAGMTTATLAQPLPAGAAVARGYRFAQAPDEIPCEPSVAGPSARCQHEKQGGRSRQQSGCGDQGGKPPVR
jgi:CubicO group peptidase (beta-lactamase class C family)